MKIQTCSEKDFPKRLYVDQVCWGLTEICSNVSKKPWEDISAAARDQIQNKKCIRASGKLKRNQIFTMSLKPTEGDELDVLQTSNNLVTHFQGRKNINNPVWVEQIYYSGSADPSLSEPDNDISVRANEMGQFSNSLQSQLRKQESE